MRKPFIAEDFKKKAIQIHGDRYDYSHVLDSPSSSYVKVQIACSEHGNFLQEAGYHLKGSGCPQCARKKVNGAISKKFVAKDFEDRAKQIHGDLYDYSLVKDSETSTYLKVDLVCRLHGLFSVAAKDHLGKRGGRCPRCSKKESYGEFLVRKCLTDLNLEFRSQIKFDDLRDKISSRKLAFDFFVPSLNLLIEFDGEYHFNPPNFSKLDPQDLEKLMNRIKERDEMKTKYARDNGFAFLRIHYSKRNPADIFKLIKSFIKWNTTITFQ